MSFELIGASCERRGHLGGAVAALLAHSQAAALFSYNQQKNAYPSVGGQRIQTVKDDLLFRG